MIHLLVAWLVVVTSAVPRDEPTVVRESEGPCAHPSSPLSFVEPFVCFLGTPAAIAGNPGNSTTAELLANSDPRTLLVVATKSSPQVSSQIPSTIGEFSNLVVFSTTHGVSGPLPSELGLLTNLLAFEILKSSAGQLPSQLGQLSSLQQLTLAHLLDAFVRYIPLSLLTSPSLVRINLKDSAFFGTLPSQLGTLSNITKLDMQKNNFNGSIPSQLGVLSKLGELYVNNNNLGGSLPSELGNMTSALVLDAAFNGLTGSLPSELGKMGWLVELRLSNNALEGSIPSEFGCLSSLTWLDLNTNQLSGTLPSTLGRLQHLRVLNLGNNALFGTLPGTMRRLTSLLELNVANNGFVGSLVQLSQFLLRLRAVYTTNNTFSGRCPPGVWKEHCLWSGLDDSACKQPCECDFRKGELQWGTEGGKFCANVRCVPVEILLPVPLVFALVTAAVLVWSKFKQHELRRAHAAQGHDQGIVSQVVYNRNALTSCGKSVPKAVVVGLFVAADVFQLELCVVVLHGTGWLFWLWVALAIFEIANAGKIMHEFNAVARLWVPEVIVAVVALRAMVVLLRSVIRRSNVAKGVFEATLVRFQIKAASLKLFFNLAGLAIQSAVFVGDRSHELQPALALGSSLFTTLVSLVMVCVYVKKRELNPAQLAALKEEVRANNPGPRR